MLRFATKRPMLPFAAEESPDQDVDLPVVVLVYDGAAGDESGAIVEILSAAGIDVVLASVEAHPVTSYHGRLVPRQPAAAFGDIAALVVPGGMGVRAASRDERLLAALGRLGERATWIGATSTGSVLVAAAGLADGANLTTHWLARDLIDESDHATLSAESFVEYGRLLTASGLASTATLGFRLVGALRGVESEAAVRARYKPSPAVDARYERRPRRRVWPSLGRRKSVTVLGPSERHIADPTGEAEIVVLDLLGED